MSGSRPRDEAFKCADGKIEAGKSIAYQFFGSKHQKALGWDAVLLYNNLTYEVSWRSRATFEDFSVFVRIFVLKKSFLSS